MKIALRSTLVGLALAAAAPAHAGEVRNLNEVCQDYILTESENRKADIRDESGEKNVIYQFRYLQVLQIGTNVPVKGAVTLMTREPGSKMKVQLQAENQKKAFRYAQNRWPNATVGKPELVK